VWLCCADQDVQHALGNLNKDSIESVWFNELNQATFMSLALGEPGAPQYCIEKCDFRIDHSLATMSKKEFQKVRLKKLLTLGKDCANENNPMNEMIFPKNEPELYVRHALSMAPDDPDALRMMAELSDNRPQGPGRRLMNRRAESFFGKVISFVSK
jgi:hypothetical protein